MRFVFLCSVLQIIICLFRLFCFPMVLSHLKFTVSDCLFGIFRFLFDSYSSISHVYYHITDISTVVRLCVMYVQYIYIYIYIYIYMMSSLLQTILDVYNCFTCIVALYRNDPTPRKIDRWLGFQTLYIYIYIHIYIYIYVYLEYLSLHIGGRHRRDTCSASKI